MASHLFVRGSRSMDSIPSANMTLQVVEGITRQELEADWIDGCGVDHHAEVVDPKQQLQDIDGKF